MFDGKYGSNFDIQKQSTYTAHKHECLLENEFER